MKAIPVKDAYDAEVIHRDYDNTNWLVFHYSDEDKDPWKWPKFMECDGRVYRWMSWNSDKHTINYKECLRSEIAKPVKGRK